MQRDAIYAALLTELNALKAPPYNVAVVSRGFVIWDEAYTQPAVYIAPKTEEATYKQGLPTAWKIKLDLWVYVQWKDSVSGGVTALAQIMDGVDSILSPVGTNAGPGGGNGYVNTLGGLVRYAALQGAADISGGFLNQMQAVACMPVEILVA